MPCTYHYKEHVNDQRLAQGEKRVTPDTSEAESAQALDTRAANGFGKSRRGAKWWRPFVSCQQESPQLCRHDPGRHIFKGLQAIDSKRFFFPFGSESINRSTVVFTSCTIFFKAVDECTRVSAVLYGAANAEDMDPKRCRVQGRM